jgi:hypothetical protein
MAEVALRFHPSLARVRVRELSGADEQLVAAASTADAVRLIAAVIADGAGAPDASSLAAADRDRLLAALYEISFGRRIDSTVRCARCGEMFDVDFRLDDLVAACDRSTPDTLERCAPDRFRLPSGVVFRLPTAAEEIASALGDDAINALADRCIVEPAGATLSLDELERAMDSVAPPLDVELSTRCAECGAAQEVRFDVQSYVLSAILNERRRLWHDVHRIASTYHWSRREILELPRSERRDMVERIESDAFVRRRPV